jgi:hypothetical protein
MSARTMLVVGGMQPFTPISHDALVLASGGAQRLCGINVPSKHVITSSIPDDSPSQVAADFRAQGIPTSTCRLGNGTAVVGHSHGGWSPSAIIIPDRR